MTTHPLDELLQFAEFIFVQHLICIHIQVGKFPIKHQLIIGRTLPTLHHFDGQGTFQLSRSHVFALKDFDEIGIEGSTIDGGARAPETTWTHVT